ncbi:MAG TPA: hypothetical protein VNC50_14800, partial [Planctomycetia bacterium]|nr:hypothetical protein [Planctomycetia bacterium]
QGWIDQLDAGESRDEVIDGILNSREYIGKAVNDLYRRYLGRDADQPSLQLWIDSVQGRSSLEEVAIELMASSEYASRHPGSSEFVEAVYRDTLGRAPTQQEIDVYLANELVPDDRDGRLRVAVEVIFSGEHDDLQTMANIGAFLHRFATDQEIADYHAGRVGAEDEIGLISDILKSDEYYNFDQFV